MREPRGILILRWGGVSPDGATTPIQENIMSRKSAARPQGPMERQFHQRVAALVSAGKTRRDAVKHIAAHEPRLHQDFIAEVNRRG